MQRMSADEFRKRRGNKYGAKRCEEDGHSFDSMVERDFYGWLKEIKKPEDHIEVHPVFTLQGGIRYKADFVLVKPVAKSMAVCVVYDVKGMKPKTGFWNTKKLFDSCHPLAPLRVVRRVRGEWVEVGSAREWA